MKDELKDLMPDLNDPVEPHPADAAFDDWIARVAPALDAPKATPRSQMWEEIQARRATARDAQAGRIPGVTPIRGRPWRLMALIAAALLLGVAVDRMALRRNGADPIVASAPDAAPASGKSPASIYRLAASQTLTQAEALLTAYRASGDAERDAVGARQLGQWGREVLGSTRLLIDSPAGTDPQLRALLEDLELVLVQLIQLSRGPLDPTDRDHVDRALEDSDLLPRIRTAVPAGVAAAASSD